MGSNNIWYMFLELGRTLYTVVMLDYILVKHRFKKYERLADTVCRIYWLCPRLIGCKIPHWIEENSRVPTGKHKKGFLRVYAQRQVVQNTVEEKFGAIACESENVQVQWENIKKSVLDTISDLVEYLEKTARKPWNT